MAERVQVRCYAGGRGEETPWAGLPGGDEVAVRSHVRWLNVVRIHPHALVCRVDRLPGERYPLGLLTMVVSLESIFLSTFVMIGQRCSKGATGPFVRPLRQGTECHEQATAVFRKDVAAGVIGSHQRGAGQFSQRVAQHAGRHRIAALLKRAEPEMQRFEYRSSLAAGGRHDPAPRHRQDVDADHPPIRVCEQPQLWRARMLVKVTATAATP